MSDQIRIHDNTASSVVKDLAKNLNTEYEHSHHEYCINIPEEFGSGHVKAYLFDSGFGVIETDYLLKKELTIEMKKDIVHPLKFIFVRQAKVKHSFVETEGSHVIKRLENAIVASTPLNNHTFTMPANEAVCIFSIEINRKEFEKKIESFLPEMNDDLIALFRDVNGIQEFFYKNNFSLEISKFIEEFTECELEGFMRHVYLEGKAYEIFTHQLKQYLDDLNEPDKRVILRQSTIEKIEEAASIIKEEMDTLMNVTEIAKRVGLNQNTLQSGFKILYEASVNEFIRNHRVDSAKELMETTDLNITQITYKIGINSRSYFTKLFKKRYGVTPKSYLEQARGKKKDSTKSA